MAIDVASAAAAWASDALSKPGDLPVTNETVRRFAKELMGHAGRILVRAGSWG
jgi:hypothetical protein